MSRFLVIALVVAALAASGLVTWIFIPGREPVADSTSAVQPALDQERRAYREKFFGGDADRDIRAGQEMKPRW